VQDTSSHNFVVVKDGSFLSVCVCVHCDTGLVLWFWLREVGFEVDVDCYVTIFEYLLPV
jgi:hypothetical protein